MKKTDDLLKELSAASDINEYFSNNEQEMISNDFSFYLQELAAQSRLDKSEIARRSGLDRYYVYEIFRGRKLPGADKIVCLALAFGLDLEATQRLLKIASRPILYVKKPRDSIIIFAINHKKTVDETNAMLFEAGEPCLLD